MTIRVNTNTLAALDMVSAELRVRTGRSVSVSDMIWHLIEQTSPHVTERIQTLGKEAEAGSGHSDKAKSEN